MVLAQFRKSALLGRVGFRHAFFTRGGGVSAGPYASLNFSVAVGDSQENVDENLRRAAAVLGVAVPRIYFASQIHGRNVLEVDGTEDRQAVLFREADAVLSRHPDVACAVRIADCVPVLLGDPATGDVAAVHAGWRGVVAGVVEHAVSSLGAGRGTSGFVAAIGPHISVRAFEVSEDVARQLREASPDPDVVNRTLGIKPHVDLRRIVRAQLRRAGLADDHIDDVAGCTVADPDLFSYRRDGKRSGRHLAAIVANPPG